MIITNEIKLLARAIADNTARSDESLRLLVTKLNESCQSAENIERYAERDRSFKGLQSYPIDEDGYAVGFDQLEDEEGFLDAWQRYGIVVGKEIVTKEECARTIKGLSSRFNRLSLGTCDLSRPETWHNMPRDANGTPLLSRGFLEIYHDDLLAQVRQNVRAYLHQVLIWGRADLWTSFDRVGVKLPHHEESKALPLHVDQNPNIHPGFKTVQGVLALTDCPSERGTFMGVAGSKGLFAQYAGMAKNAGEYIELDGQHPIATELQAQAQAIPLRAGDMVSWDSRTTHANTENISDDMRMVLYIAAGPAREDSPEAVAARLDGFRTGVGSNVREALMHASKKPRYTDPAALAQIRQPEHLNLLGRLLYGTERYAKIDGPAAP